MRNPRVRILFGLTALLSWTTLVACGEGGATAACDKIVRIANTGQLVTALRREDALFRAPPGQEHLQFLGRIHLASGAEVHAWGGKLAGVVAFKDAETPVDLLADPAIDWDADRYRWADPVGIFPHGGLEYFVWYYMDQLAFVTQIESDLTQKMVCEFGQRGEKARRLLKGSGAVCEAARDENIDRVRFGLAQKEIKIPSHDHVDIRTSGSAALVDIDNDGRAERIAETSIHQKGANPCESQGIAVLDAEGDKPDMNATRLLASSGGECGHWNDSFIFAGKFYFETREAVLVPAPADRVYEIEGGQPRLVCEIESLPINFVLP
jgi:hypothetical protein